jgi:D-alanine-D-alanine ligase
VVQCAQDIAGVTLDLPLFVKPLAEGTGKGTSAASVIRSRDALRDTCIELLARYDQPVLIERYLPGREFTVGLLGTGPDARVLGTLEIVLLARAEAGVYSYLNKVECEERVEYRLVSALDDPLVAATEAAALRAWRVLGCRDGGRVDLRTDDLGLPCFIEANPLAGLHPHHSDLPMLATAVGMTYDTLIGEIIDSAAERLRGRVRSQCVA